MVILALLAAAQPTYVEQPTSGFDGPLVAFACSDASDIRQNVRLLIGAVRLDGHNIVRLGGQQPGWWLRQSARLVDEISYYGLERTESGSNVMIRAAGETFGTRVNVEFTMHLPSRGEPSGFVVIRENGIEHRGACVPFNSGIER